MTFKEVLAKHTAVPRTREIRDLYAKAITTGITHICPVVAGKTRKELSLAYPDVVFTVATVESFGKYRIVYKLTGTV